MQATRLALLLTAFAAACSSSSREPQPAEPAELIVSGSCRRHEDTLLLAVAVTNLGRGAAAPALTHVEFNGDSTTGVSRRTRLIAAHAVDSFEVELPAMCSKAACRWNITIDSTRPVRESGRC